MNLNKKLLVGIGLTVSASILLVGCSDKNTEKELSESDKEATKYIKYKEDAKKEIAVNEEEFFEIAWSLRQLITESNDLFIIAEGILNNGNVEEFNKFVKDVNNRKSLLEQANEIEEQVKNMSRHKSNNDYNEALKVVQDNLLTGLSDYKQSIDFIENELLVLYKKEVIDVEEIQELESQYKITYEENQVVFNGNIKQMQESFALANQNFVIYLGGQFEKDYYPSVFEERLTAYFTAKSEE